MSKTRAENNGIADPQIFQIPHLSDRGTDFQSGEPVLHVPSSVQPERIDAYKKDGTAISYNQQQNSLPDLKKERPWYTPRTLVFHGMKNA
ncbi:hypothetical protein DENIS_2578 [Desulfonema ishimotonii]|uniref:Uncharacterized protein n=1 Tax=Desulfonema ishimotonii TaxID=45657 RepID=A0A401FXD8_9BACT|nr:hypothetical protein [Desulfonema ishimotonii]GBC61616.1 hypothetical protein DENIS_2578 [Desulfonema ishimotonii]